MVSQVGTGANWDGLVWLSEPLDKEELILGPACMLGGVWAQSTLGLEGRTPSLVTSLDEEYGIESLEICSLVH